MIVERLKEQDDVPGWDDPDTLKAGRRAGCKVGSPARSWGPAGSRGRGDQRNSRTENAICKFSKFPRSNSLGAISLLKDLLQEIALSGGGAALERFGSLREVDAKLARRSTFLHSLRVCPPHLSMRCPPTPTSRFRAVAFVLRR
jgi:hypothetical protein